MPSDDAQSAQWAPDAVLERLRKATASGQAASASFTIGGTVAADQVETKARQIVNDTRTRLGLAPGAVRLGKVHPRAKSFSVTSSSPEVFAEIIKQDEVKTIIENEQPGMLIEPVRRKIVP